MRADNRPYSRSQQQRGTYMKLQAISNLENIDVDTVVVPVPTGATSLNPPFSEIAEPLFRNGDLPLKPLEMLIHHGSRRTVFIGLPKATDLESWRRVAATVVRRM